jgi:hypothetical protein
MEDKVIIELDMKAIIEANRIMIDDDKTAAMRFIKDYIDPALHRLNYGHCHQMYCPKEGDEK